MSRDTYYQDQLHVIDFHQIYPAKVKFRDMNGETKFLNVNYDCAEAIVFKLIREFNIIPNKKSFDEMQIDEMWVAFGNFCQAMNDQMKKP